MANDKSNSTEPINNPTSSTQIVKPVTIQRRDTGNISSLERRVDDSNRSINHRKK